MSEVTGEPGTLSRVERKRQEARARIIEAAGRLMREGKIDEVTISDITEAADVGHGSFYLHFNSKHDVLLPILVAEAAAMDARLRRGLRDVEDPAEIVGLSARYMGYAIVRDPMWRWFLSHSGVPIEDMREAFGRFSQRDVGAGLKTGRFNPIDARVSLTFAFGGFVSALLASFEAEEPTPIIDAAVATLLVVLGIEPGEARAIAAKSLAHIQ